ncbi:ANK_REP_REGION domain-containing protein, partial [Haematococcus lacustris]
MQTIKPAEQHVCAATDQPTYCLGHVTLPCTSPYHRLFASNADGSQPPLSGPSATSATYTDCGNQRFPVFQLSSAEDSQPPKTIFEAAERGNAAYITHMMERTIEFDINQQDSFQRTALHWAAEMGHVNVASVLKDYGINVGATECNGSWGGTGSGPAGGGGAGGI